MKTTTRIIFVALILSIFLAACQPTRVMIDPTSIEGQDHIAHGDSLWVPVPQDAAQGPTFKEFWELITECPISQYSEEVLQLAGITEADEVHICQSVNPLLESSVYFVSFTSIPATLEPGVAVEGLQGVVLAGGVIIGIITTSNELRQYGTSLNEIAATSELIPAMQSLNAIAGTWDQAYPRRIPQDAYDVIPAHSMAKHATAACVLAASKSLRADRVYYASSSPKKSPQQTYTGPTVLFLWDGQRVLSEIGKTSAACASLGISLMTSSPHCASLIRGILMLRYS